MLFDYFLITFSMDKYSKTCKLSCMSNTILVEIAGFKDSFCGPFPCDGDRTCDLEKCAPSEKLVNAVDALRERFAHIYGDKVEVRLTLLDDGIPDHIAEIVEKDQPPIPMVIVNGKITPIGRISLPQISEEVNKVL